MDRTELVGRLDALTALRRAAEAAAAGRGGVVLVTGEAGIGKTAVVAEAAAAAAGARVVWAACWRGEGAPGYWPWVQVARALVPDPRTPALRRLLSGAAERLDEASPAAARFQLFDELATAVLERAAERPLVVVLDDLQWADPPSLLLLDFLARRLRAAPALVIGTCRDGEVAPGDPAAGPLAAVAAAAALLPLAALDEPDTARVMAGVLGRAPEPGLAAEVHRRTGGNPFFVQQVTRLLGGPADAGLPLGARDAIERRLARLGADCGQVLALAAVAGPEVSPAVLARVTGRPVAGVVDLLDEAARARVLTRPDAPLGPYRFVHDLFREAILERLGGAARSRLHLELARVLAAEREAGGAARLTELADHFALGAAAGRREEAARWMRLAAWDASRRLAHDEAARHWRHVVEALEAGAGGPAAQAEALLELGDAARRAGDGEAGRAACWRAAALARRAGDGPALAAAALAIHAGGTRTGEPPLELIALLEEARDALGTGPTGLRACVLAALARVLAWSGRDVGRAAELADAAVATARRAGDLEALGACLLATHNVVWGPGTAGQRLALAGEVAEVAAETGDRELLAEARLLRVADLLELGDPAVHAELTALAAQADELRQPRLRHAALLRLAAQATMTGRFSEAERLVEEVSVLGREIGDADWLNVHRDQVWDLRTLQGRRAELLDELADWWPPGTVRARWFRVVSLLERGERREAELAAGSLFAAPPPAARNHDWLLGLAYGAELVAELGPEAAREALYAELLPFAGSVVVSGVMIACKGSVSHYLGLLAASLGRRADAEAHLERAVAVHERLGARPWALLSRHRLARLRAGDPGAAAELAAVAREAERLGMAGLAAEALAPIGRGVFRREGADWVVGLDGVTARMADAKGLGDIAALLRAPGRAVAAADLVAAAEAPVRAQLGMGADAVLDERARREYRARLADLDEDIAEAERWADPERAARAREEREALVAELAAAAGLGGRPRRLGDQSERARKTVTARIRDVLTRMDAAHPPLAAHLRASVRTGTSCTYTPPAPVEWEL